MTKHNNHSHEDGTEHPISKMLLAKAANFEDEIIAGYEAIQQYPRTVSFFGSARFEEDNVYYQQARELAGIVCREGYTVVSGGGDGIMEAANRGSKETCDTSVGFNIKLPHEQEALNEHVTHGVDFSFFASRKVALYFSGEAYIFFPGGYGTLDEFFQILTLMQTHKTPTVPVICVGSEYWNSIDTLVRDVLLEQQAAISLEDPGIYTILDDNEAIMQHIHEAHPYNAR